MIIKIDHLALATDDSGFEPLTDFFGSLGYELNFLEKNKKNLDIKLPLMKNFYPTHDLALLTAKNSIGIEVINYKRVNEADSNFIPVFKNLPNKFLKDENSDNTKNLNSIMYIHNPVYLQNDGKKVFDFKNLIIKTADFDESVKFWNAFGFKKVKINGEAAEMEFKSLFGDSFDIRIEKSEKTNDQVYLDDSGFNSFAFVSNSAPKEKERIGAAGIKTTDIERMDVNGKRLDIFFACGDQGEIAEIISIKQ